MSGLVIYSNNKRQKQRPCVSKAASLCLTRLGSTTKPVTEFLKNMGNGNEHDGMNTVIRIMNSDSVLSQYIQSGAEGDRVNMSKAEFMYYLISEWEKENKR